MHKKRKRPSTCVFLTHSLCRLLTYRLFDFYKSWKSAVQYETEKRNNKCLASPYRGLVSWLTIWGTTTGPNMLGAGLLLDISCEWKYWMVKTSDTSQCRFQGLLNLIPLPLLPGKSVIGITIDY